MAIPRTARLLACLLLLAAGAAVLFSLDPAASRLFPPCPFHEATGLYCPGCGSLRAIHQLLHGRLLEAARLNPLMVASLPVIALLLLPPEVLRFRDRFADHPATGWAVLALVLAYWIARNIPLEPFSWLAPHEGPGLVP